MTDRFSTEPATTPTRRRSIPVPAARCDEMVASERHDANGEWSGSAMKSVALHIRGADEWMSR